MVTSLEIYLLYTRLEIYSFSQSSSFPLFLFEGRGAAALGGVKIPRDQERSQIGSESAHRDGARRGLGCSHYTWSLNNLWVASPWTEPCERLLGPPKKIQMGPFEPVAN